MSPHLTPQQVKTTIIELKSKFGRFPKISDVATALKSNPYHIGQFYRRFTENGFLIRSGNLYRLADEWSPVEPDAETSPEIEPEEKPEVVENPTTEIYSKNAADSVPIRPALPRAGKRESPTPVTRTQSRGFSLKSFFKSAVAKAKAELTEKPVDGVSGTTIVFIRLVMLVVGIGAVAVSASNAFTYLQNAFVEWAAHLMAFMLCAFGSVAFVVMEIFASKAIIARWYRWALVALFFLIWLGLTAFMMFCTINAQYSKYSAAQIAAAAAKEPETAVADQIAQIDAEILNLNQQIKIQDDLLAPQNRLVSSVTDLTALYVDDVLTTLGRTYYAAQGQIKTINAERTRLQSDLKKQKEARAAIVTANQDIIPQTAAIDVPDIFSWIAGVFGQSKDSVQFWINTFPALFCDIIAPLGFSIALFLRRRRTP